MTNNLTKVIILFFFIGMLAACGGGEEETTNANPDDNGTNAEEPAANKGTDNGSNNAGNEAESEGNSNADADGDAEAETGETVETGDDLPLPGDFPDDFPLPNGATINEIRTEVQTTYKSYAVDFVFDQDLESTYQMYIDYANNNDYEISMDKEIPGSGFMLSTNPLADYSFGATIGIALETEGTVMYTLPN